MDAVADRLLAKLRTIAPHKVRVYDSSDEHRDVAVPNRRKRWSQVIETIEARPWVKCELLAKDGSILGYVENEGPANEVEDITGGGTARERWLIEAMIRAQRTALEYRDKEHVAALNGMSALLNQHSHAVRELVELYKVQRDVAADIAHMQAVADGGSVEQIVKILEANPKLVQVLGPIIMGMVGKVAGALMPGKSAPNGAKS